jgi:anti-anti-sigma factor
MATETGRSRGAELKVWRSGRTTHARLLGPVSLETVPRFQKRLAVSLGGECRALWLDLGAADYVDSNGVRWLQTLREELEARGIELFLAVREGSRAERTFNLLQLDRGFRIERYPDEGEAAATLLSHQPGL